MGNLARKVIDAVQHTMLDKLFLRVVSFWFLAVLWDGGGTAEVSAGLFLVAATIFAIAWVLGALARRRQPTGRPALERVDDPPSNGFEVWGRPPAGGLRPPPVMRALVTTMGASGENPMPRWLALAALAVFAAVAVFAWALAVKPPGFWQAIPWLMEPSNRKAILIGVIILFAVLIVRGWASEQRALLESRKVRFPASSRWFDYAVLMVFTGAFAAFAVLWGAPRWITLSVVGLIAVAGLFREHEALNFLFGKRGAEPPTAR